MDHSYLRPPPPHHAPLTAADPYQRPVQVTPPQQSHQWPYSNNQFQYQIQHSPSPSPAQWPPQLPQSYDHTQYSYPPPPPPPYPAHTHYPHSHPLPTEHPHFYTQDFGSGSWSYQPSWNYPTNNKEEDWAAKARAWAVAKAEADHQHPPPGIPEDQYHFHNQHSQLINPQFPSVHVPVDQVSSYPQYPMGGPSDRTELDQLHESQSIGSVQSSYAVEMHIPHEARDGSLTRSSFGSTSFQEKSSIDPLAYQQEVPSSYSSVSGVRSGTLEEHNHFLSNKPAEPAGLSDQLLNFTQFTRNLDQHTLPLGGPARNLDPNMSMSSNYSWTHSTAPEVGFPRGPPPIPSGLQVDHPTAVLSPATGHSAPIFPTGHGFQPRTPLIGASFGVGSGVAFHPAASFSADSYGVSSVSERPKKASVPNWLREEIIKSKVAITSSGPKLPHDDSQSIEDTSSDKYTKKGDQTDTKSIDSSQSYEDGNEDENEDVEAARTAAINKEIKRVLTEVLLKVTDELFDEIATKVLNEDDLSVEVGRNIDPSNQHVLPSTPIISTLVNSAKVTIPTKILEIDNEDVSEKSTYGSAGDVLGLASYASDEDDDDDDDVSISGKLQSKELSRHQQPFSNKLLGDTRFTENGGSRTEMEEQGNPVAKVENEDKWSSTISTSNLNAEAMEFNTNVEARDLAHSEVQRSSKTSSFVDGQMQRNGSDIPQSGKTVTTKAVERNERLDGTLNAKMSNGDSLSQKGAHKFDQSDLHEKKRNSVGTNQESERAKQASTKRGDEDHRRHEQKHARTDMIEYRNWPKDKEKEKGRIEERAKDSESMKQLSPSNFKDGRSDSSRERRASGKEINHEKNLDKTRGVKKDKFRHKDGSNSSRYKPQQSSPVGSRDSHKDNLIVEHSNYSSDDESLGDSKRKSHHSKRHKSPSPDRSRRRQVSRSPHSKHSKSRRNSFSSLENTRGRSPSRSRSRSPVRRRH